MSSLDKRKTRLIFTTSDAVRSAGRLRQVVIEAQPHYALVRLAGTRTSYPISYAAIFSLAAKLRAEKDLSEIAARLSGAPTRGAARRKAGGRR